MAMVIFAGLEPNSVLAFFGFEMNYWILTDTHFGHEQMHKYCQRLDDFEDRILRQTRHKVKAEDVLIHLGDFCVGQDEYWHREFMAACLGKRWLVRGNHDRKSNTWYHRNGWDFVADRAELNQFGRRIVLTHKPIDESGDYVNVHGHHHNTGHHPEDETDGRHKLVFIEHEYTPVMLRRIVEG